MSDITFRKIGTKIRILKDHAWVHRPDVPEHLVHLSGFNDGEKGPSAETLRLWIRDKKSPKVETVREMCEVINSKFDVATLLTVEHLADHTTVEQLLDAIGEVDDIRRLSKEFTRWAQESRLCATFTFRPNQTLGSSSRSTFSFVRLQPGLYNVHRRRLGTNPADEDLITMAILQPTAASNRRTEGEEFIPCVMGIRARKSSALFRYKGVVGPLENGIEWRFFQEGTQNLDRIVIMSNRVDVRNGHVLEGHMVTVTQGPDYRSMAASVTIEYAKELPALEGINQFLETARLIESADRTTVKVDGSVSNRRSTTASRVRVGLRTIDAPS